MFIKVILYIVVLVPVIANAKVCVKCFGLTNEQIEIIEKLQDTRNLSEKTIMLLIKASLKHTERLNQENYIPEATDLELMAIRNWLVGDVVSFYSKKAGFDFDSERYLNDYPIKDADGKNDYSVLNYARAHGQNTYSVNLMSLYEGLSVNLDRLLREDRDGFIKELIRIIEEYKYSDYFSKYKYI